VSDDFGLGKQDLSYSFHQRRCRPCSGMLQTLSWRVLRSILSTRIQLVIQRRIECRVDELPVAIHWIKRPAETAKIQQPSCVGYTGAMKFCLNSLVHWKRSIFPRKQGDPASCWCHLPPTTIKKITLPPGGTKLRKRPIGTELTVEFHRLGPSGSKRRVEGSKRRFQLVGARNALKRIKSHLDKIL
jgi:hypothetical protein